MSNTSNGKAVKGSKMQMQRITEKENQQILNKLFDDELKWLSPCRKDNYREYQLNNPGIKKLLGIKSNVFKDFWPPRQPQWDGIAIGKSGALYLFEAKSHLNEIQRSRIDKSELIRKSISHVAYSLTKMDLKSEKEHEIWYHKFYQIANRLVFLEKMKEIATLSDKFNDVVLVFLNFVNDRSWEEEKQMVKSSEEWDSHYAKIFDEMRIDQSTFETINVRILNVDLDKVV